MPAILEKIVQWLLPYIINYAQKHIPEVLDYMVKSAKDKYNEFMKEGQEKMSVKLTLSVKNQTGTPISGAKVAYTVGAISTIGATNESGIFTVSDILAGINTFTLTAAGYQDKKISYTLVEEENTFDVVLETAATTQAAVSPVGDIISGIVSSFVFNPPTSFGDAKKQYDELKENIKEQKDVIEKAFGITEITVLQTQAANLMYTVKKSFQPAMDYYVSERSKLNPFGSWVQFRDYIETTSMIGGIYLARYEILNYISKLEDKIKSMLSV